MKRLRTWMLLLASCALVCVSSCKKDEPAPVKASLSVSGGTEVVVSGSDVTKDITVTAAEAAAEDLTVKLSSDAAEGEAAFEKAELVLAAGQTSVTGKITFKADKFPAGTAQKAIKVTIECAAADIKEASTTFLVKGEGGQDVNNFEATAPSAAINTAAGDTEAKIAMKLTKALDADLTVAVDYGDATTIVTEGVYVKSPWGDDGVYIAKGSTSVDLVLNIPKNTTGVLELTFAVENPDVTVKTPSVTMNFTNDGGTVVPGEGLCVVESGRGTQYAYNKSFTVNGVASPVREVQNVYWSDFYNDYRSSMIVEAEAGAELPISITHFNKCSGEGDPYRAVAWIDLNKDGDVPAAEKVFSKEFTAAEPYGDYNGNATPGAQPEKVIDGTFTIPAGTPAGDYIMRIGSMFYDTGFGAVESGDPESGCAKYETVDLYDITIRVGGGEPAPEKVILTATAEQLTFNTTDAPQTATINVVLSEALEENLVLMGEVLPESTLTMAQIESINPAVPMTIPAGQTSLTIEITVKQGAAGTLSFGNFSTDNEEKVDIAATTLDFTFTADGGEEPEPGEEPTPLCVLSGRFETTWAALSGFTIGDLTEKSLAPDGVMDLTSKTANVADGGDLAIFGIVNDGSEQMAHATMWIDWNNDGLLTADEVVLTSERQVAFSATETAVLSGTLTAPETAAAGKYNARIGVYYQVYAPDTMGNGCAAEYESSSWIDVRVNFTK